MSWSVSAVFRKRNGDVKADEALRVEIFPDFVYETEDYDERRRALIVHHKPGWGWVVLRGTKLIDSGNEEERFEALREALKVIDEGRA